VVIFEWGWQVKDTDIIAAVAPDAVSLMDKAIAEIKRLRAENSTLTAERDEARREVCNLSIHPPRDYALERGWFCFKEEP
jgi:hypothetical protein